MTSTRTIIARRLDDRASSSTLATILNNFVDKRSDLLSNSDTTLALTVLTRYCFTIFGTCTRAGFALHRQIKFNRFFTPCQDRGQFNAVAKENVRATTFPAATTTATKESREEISSEKILEVDVKSASRESPKGISSRTVMTESIVVSTLVWIRENSVSLLNFLEFFLGIGLFAPVWVIASSESPECILQVFFCR